MKLHQASISLPETNQMASNGTGAFLIVLTW